MQQATPAGNSSKDSSYTFSGIHRPFPIRAANWMGSVLDRFGITLYDHNEDSLVRAACRRTGLSDWGDDSYKVPLKILLDSAKKDANMDLLGRFVFRSALINHLSNRLRIQDEIKRHPEITQEPIRQPLFILSIPRTGTTLLHNLLGQDLFNRPLLNWEASCPTPPPERQTKDTDPRITAADRNLRNLHYMAPYLSTIHPASATSPEECISLFMNSLYCSSFVGFGKVTSYIAWLKKQDMVPAYRYYRMQLQLLQSRYPTHRWVLKSPMHLNYLNELLTVFPDACIIQTHRDPLKAVPSICSLNAAYLGMLYNSLSLEFIGAVCNQIWPEALDKAMKIRDNSKKSHFIDILYKDLVKSPIETIKKIYDYFGFDYTKEFEERMKAWIAKNPKNKHGVHRYSLEQFGLTADEVNRQFAEYIERFEIPRE